jgi:uncharacterized protein YpbB
MALRVHPEVLSHDEEFREISDVADQTFSSLPAEELTKMHKDFVVASGGTYDGNKKISSQHTESKQNKEKISTLHITKNLIDTKMSIADIAKTRTLIEGTIVGHVESIKKHYPNTDIEYLRPSGELVASVKKAYENADDGKLATVKVLLEKEGKEISYHEIRLALLFV